MIALPLNFFTRKHFDLGNDLMTDFIENNNKQKSILIAFLH